MSNVSKQLNLRIIWLKNVLGLAIDQEFEKQKYPLTQYYFWPRTEAWDQLKLELDSKSWLSETEKITFLNLVTDVISHWRNYRSKETVEDFAKNFKDATFVKLYN